MATWKQVWAIEAHSHSKTGETVVVFAKSGKSKQVILGQQIAPGVFLPAVEPIEDTPPPAVDVSQQGFKEAFAAMKAKKQLSYNEAMKISQKTGEMVSSILNRQLDGRDDI